MQNRNTQRIASLAMVAAAMMSIAATFPSRADDTVTSSRAVSVQGLDLSLTSDQVVLRHRLRVAAAKVCADEGGSSRLNDAAFSECHTAAYREAWAQAQVLIASAASRSLFAARTLPGSTKPDRLFASASTQAGLPGR